MHVVAADFPRAWALWGRNVRWYQEEPVRWASEIQTAAEVFTALAVTDLDAKSLAQVALARTTLAAMLPLLCETPTWTPAAAGAVSVPDQFANRAGFRPPTLSLPSLGLDRLPSSASRGCSARPSPRESRVRPSPRALASPREGSAWPSPCTSRGGSAPASRPLASPREEGSARPSPRAPASPREGIAPPAPREGSLRPLPRAPALPRGVSAPSVSAPSPASPGRAPLSVPLGVKSCRSSRKAGTPTSIYTADFSVASSVTPSTLPSPRGATAGSSPSFGSQFRLPSPRGAATTTSTASANQSTLSSACQSRLPSPRDATAGAATTNSTASANQPTLSSASQSRLPSPRDATVGSSVSSSANQSCRSSPRGAPAVRQSNGAALRTHSHQSSGGGAVPTRIASAAEARPVDEFETGSWSATARAAAPGDAGLHSCVSGVSGVCSCSGVIGSDLGSSTASASNSRLTRERVARCLCLAGGAPRCIYPPRKGRSANTHVERLRGQNTGWGDPPPPPSLPPSSPPGVPPSPPHAPPPPAPPPPSLPPRSPPGVPSSPPHAPSPPGAGDDTGGGALCGRNTGGGHHKNNGWGYRARDDTGGGALGGRNTGGADRAGDDTGGGALGGRNTGGGHLDADTGRGSLADTDAVAATVGIHRTASAASASTLASAAATSATVTAAAAIAPASLATTTLAASLAAASVAPAGARGGRRADRSLLGSASQLCQAFYHCDAKAGDFHPNTNFFLCLHCSPDKTGESLVELGKAPALKNPQPQRRPMQRYSSQRSLGQEDRKSVV